MWKTQAVAMSFNEYGRLLLPPLTLLQTQKARSWKHDWSWWQVASSSSDSHELIECCNCYDCSYPMWPTARPIYSWELFQGITPTSQLKGWAHWRKVIGEPLSQIAHLHLHHARIKKAYSLHFYTAKLFVCIYIYLCIAWYTYIFYIDISWYIQPMDLNKHLEILWHFPPWSRWGWWFWNVKHDGPGGINQCRKRGETRWDFKSMVNKPLKKVIFPGG